jgi:hypothetical protein
MSTLLRSDSFGSKPVSAFGILVPRRVARWFARLWISAVIVGSLLPGSIKVMLRASEGKSTYSRNALTRHRLIHFFAFGSSFFLLSLLATGSREELEAAGEVMAIGCIVELAQYLISDHRYIFEWWDVRDDAIGIAVVFLLVQICSRANSAISSR